MRRRCVVVDDEKPARDRVKRLLDAHSDFELAGEAADAEAAVRLIDETRPDLCFLDVQMPEGTGFDVLQRVGHVPHVIFVTAYDRYAVPAFEVRSIDYLLKPVGRERFALALDRARERIDGAGSARRILGELDALRRSAGERPAGAAPRPDRLSVRSGSGIRLLDPDEIVWFEADDALVFARTAGGRFLVDRTLSELERQLAGAVLSRTPEPPGQPRTDRGDSAGRCRHLHDRVSRRGHGAAVPPAGPPAARDIPVVRAAAWRRIQTADTRCATAHRNPVADSGARTAPCRIGEEDTWFVRCRSDCCWGAGSRARPRRPARREPRPASM